MPTRIYESLVLDALKKRSKQPSKAVAVLREAMPAWRFEDLARTYAPWVRELAEVNDHITIKPEEIEAAAKAYQEVGQHLCQKLDWPREDAHVFPQGSASTRTLIRSPNGGEKFDIDAVCDVNVDLIDANDPLGFFDRVGNALRPYEPTAKNRCWNINFTKRPFYLEFTPSIPLETAPIRIRQSITQRFKPVEQYHGTALAVVDRKTGQWKTSNPQGMTRWVNDAAQLRLLQQRSVGMLKAMRESAGVDDVPKQNITMADTLCVAIRLFKRHRDISVRRGRIEKDFQPISIILVTLLTSCYIGLHQNQQIYDHPIELLVDLAELLPWMVENRDGEHWIANPTVEGENFAEKWNEQGSQHYQVFHRWCDILALDMRLILQETDHAEIRRRVFETFGVPDSHDSAPSTTAGLGLGGMPPTRRPPAAPPKSRGLA